MKIECKTLFDCTTTGITGSFRPSMLPCKDATGHEIQDQTEWNRRRNKQRNWETLLQILQLRSQIEIIDHARQTDRTWQFVFEVESDLVYGTDFQDLYRDADGVPMLIGLDEKNLEQRSLKVQGADQNIWFTAINI